MLLRIGGQLSSFQMLILEKKNQGLVWLVDKTICTSHKCHYIEHVVDCLVKSGPSKAGPAGVAAAPLFSGNYIGTTVETAF